MPPIDPFTRREFLAAAGAAGAVAASQGLAGEAAAAAAEPLALNGGPKAVRGAVASAPRWGDPERALLSATVDQPSLFYWQGPQTKLFTERFRKVCPLEHVMTCSSGTAALHIAVAAAGIAPGDEVITTPITDMGTVIGVIYQQAVPVFAELVPNTYNLDPADVERKITPRTKAIIAVHLGGNPCRLEELRAIADKHSLVLIEDCAQAWGAKYRGQPVGTIGDIACFSLQHSKQISCGDGGVAASNHERFGPLLQSYGDKGGDRLHPTGVYERFATNYRMTELQAAVGAAQLERLEGIVSARARNGGLLGERLRGIAGIEPHGIAADDRSSYWFYMLRLKPGGLRCDRAEFVKALAAEGVLASPGYIPVPLYEFPVFKTHGFFAGRWPMRDLGMTTMDYSQVVLPEAAAILKTGVRITVNEHMTADYIESVASAIDKVARYYAT